MDTKLRFLARGSVALSVLVVGPIAHGAQPVPDSLQRCVAIVEAADRLACFDAELQRLGVPASAAPGAGSSAAAVAASGPDGTTAPAAPPALTPEQKFGATAELQQKQQTNPDEPVLKELTENVKEVRKAPGGNYVVTLENGQVWRQITPAAMRVKVGQPVTIRVRALGSFWMFDLSGRGNRVKRIQ